MSEQTTATATTPTEATTATEAAPGTLLSSSEAGATTTQQGEPQTTEPGAAEADGAAEGTKPANDPGASKPAEGAPENYEFAAPEGRQYDARVLDTFSEAARDANLTQDAAQKVLAKMAPALAERQAEQIKAVQVEWLDASRSDREFGGAKLQENLATAKKALDRFDPLPAGQKTTQLRTLLDSTGLGSNPEVIRLLYRAGRAISEDTFVGGRGGGEFAAVNPASILYDKTPR